MNKIKFIAAAIGAVLLIVSAWSDTPALAANEPFLAQYGLGVSCFSAVTGDTPEINNSSTNCPGGQAATAVGSRPDLQVAIALGCHGVGTPPASCTGTPTDPFFDIAMSSYSSQLTVNTTAKIGAVVAADQFQIDTNQKGAVLVDSTTGSPPACGGPGTLVLNSRFDVLNASVTASPSVTGRTVPPNTLPSTQLDGNGDGLPDGVTSTPDYIVHLLGSQISKLKTRGFGIAKVVPGVVQVDVNFLTLDLTSFGQGYISLTILANSDVAYDPTASQGSLTCSPFETLLTNYGTSQQGPCNVPANCAGGDALHTIAAAAPGNVLHYALLISPQPDVNNDSVPTGLDRCPMGGVAGAPPVPGGGAQTASGTADTDNDGVGNGCDPITASAHNCPTANTYCFDATNAAAGGAAPLSYPTSPTFVGPHAGDGIGYDVWNPDQDYDGDGVLNYQDSCPSVPNRQPRVNDKSGVGAACDPNVSGIHVATSAQYPTAALTTRDAYTGGASGLIAGVDFPTAACSVNTTCSPLAHGVMGAGGNRGTTATVQSQQLCDQAFHYGENVTNTGVGGTVTTSGGVGTAPAIVCEAVQDSNASGIADNIAPFHSLGGGDTGVAAQADIGSDSDADGCSDNYEAIGGCSGDALDPHSNANAAMAAGADDVCPKDGVPDWYNDVLGTNHLAAIAYAGDCTRFWGAGGLATNPGTIGSPKNAAMPHDNIAAPNGHGSPDSADTGCSNRRKAQHVVLGGGTGVTFTTTTITDTAPFDGTFAPVVAGNFVIVGGGQWSGNVQSVAGNTITVDSCHPFGALPATPPNGSSYVAVTTVQLKAGGGRSALDPYDVGDVPVPGNDPNGVRNKSVSLGDVLAAIVYSGGSSTNPRNLNGNGVSYGGRGATTALPGDDNNDGRSNGAEYDRGPNPNTSLPITMGPNGFVTLGDALAIQAQVGLSCGATP